MREIIFRGKRVETKNWVEGSLLIYDDGDCDICSESGMPNELFKYAVDPETVGQYTGLTDKNGEKIFEGDILNENGYLFTVVYDQYWAKFKLQHDGHAIQYPEWNRGIKMEIAGNIHDNPELLTEAVP